MLHLGVGMTGKKKIPMGCCNAGKPKAAPGQSVAFTLQLFPPKK